MPIIFPSVDSATPEGLVAIGGTLDTETILTAYSQGIFPWPISKESPLTWFSPDPRGILPIDEIHLSASFKRFLNKEKFHFKFNTQFENVITECAKMSRKHEKGTWITDELMAGYINLHHQGFAYSVETYEEDKLVGGLYGVNFNSYVSGESMFHERTNASKFALYQLLMNLKEKNIPFLDTQMVTPIVESFGGKFIPRSQFISLLNIQLQKVKSSNDLFNLSQE